MHKGECIVAKKYLVQLGYQVFHQAWVEVEANSVAEAHVAAMKKAEEPLDYEADPYDDGTDLEVLDCEEVLP